MSSPPGGYGNRGGGGGYTEPPIGDPPKDVGNRGGSSSRSGRSQPELAPTPWMCDFPECKVFSDSTPAGGIMCVVFAGERRKCAVLVIHLPVISRVLSKMCSTQFPPKCLLRSSLHGLPGHTGRLGVEAFVTNPISMTISPNIITTIDSVQTRRLVFSHRGSPQTAWW